MARPQPFPRLVLLGLLLAAPAAAWSQDVSLETRVHDHAFDRVRVDATGCELTVELGFSAPAKGYASGVPARDYYRFHTRVQLSDGRQVISPVFGNRAAGRRVYRFTKDTSAEGCWAKQKHNLQGVKIEACRGKRCTPKPFE